MTTVTMFKKQGIVYGFKMEGHAGYNTKGPDILCAGLSMASQLTVSAFETLLGEAATKEYEVRSGYTMFIVQEEESKSKVSQGLFKTFIDAIESMIEDEEYGPYIKLKEENDEDN